MERNRALLLVGLAAIAVLGISPAAPAPAALQLRGKVQRVITGDTLEVRRASGAVERVRLVGVATPGLGQCFGDQALAKTRRLAGGRVVTLTVDPSQGAYDASGDLLAYVALPYGDDLGAQLFPGGFGVVSPYRQPFKRLAGYRFNEVAAQRAGRGFWDTCADLSMTVAAAPGPVTAGNELVYTITVANRGPGTAEGVTVSDALPAGESLVLSSTPCSGTSTLTCTIGSIPAGEPAILKLIVRTSAAGTDTNAVSVATAGVDITPGNNSASVTTQVKPGADLADLSATLTASPQQPTLGRVVTYTLTVVNNGPAEAVRTSACCLPPPAVPAPAPDLCGGGLLPCVLPSGETATATWKEIPHATGTRSVTVSSDTPDPDDRNNSASAAVTVLPPAATADLAVALSSSATTVTVGDRLVYTVSVANRGPDAAEDVKLSVGTNEPGVLLDSVAAVQGSCGANGLCALGSLASGASATVTVSARPLVWWIGTFDLCANGSAATFDPSEIGSGQPEKACAQATVARAAPAARVVRSDKLIGDFPTRGPATPARALDTFGRPDTALAFGEFCRERRPGLELTFLGSLDSRAGPCESGTFYEAAVSAEGWHTDRGLRIDDPVRRLRRLYPSARRHRDSYWLVARRSSYSGGDRYAGLAAKIVEGRVGSFVVRSAAAG